VPAARSRDVLVKEVLDAGGQTGAFVERLDKLVDLV